MNGLAATAHSRQHFCHGGFSGRAAVLSSPQAAAQHRGGEPLLQLERDLHGEVRGTG